MGFIKNIPPSGALNANGFCPRPLWFRYKEIDIFIIFLFRDGIFQLLRSTGIDSASQVYVAWGAGTTTLFLLRS
jgi:hypothetical protein